MYTPRAISTFQAHSISFFPLNLSITKGWAEAGLLLLRDIKALTQGDHGCQGQSPE